MFLVWQASTQSAWVAFAGMLVVRDADRGSAAVELQTEDVAAGKSNDQDTRREDGVDYDIGMALPADRIGLNGTGGNPGDCTLGPAGCLAEYTATDHTAKLMRKADSLEPTEW
jgi:hypothetical protein